MGKERERLRERVGKRERQRWRVGERELNGTGTETVGESDRGEIAMGIAMKNRVGERQRKRESLERESERERQKYRTASERHRLLFELSHLCLVK